MIQLGTNPVTFLKGLYITLLPLQLAEGKVVQQS